MILTELKIHQLRLLSSVHLDLNERFNFIIGPNGSGKTSLLEALYLLSCGHSFRSREIAPIIRHGQSLLTVFARGQNEETISIQKSHSQNTQIKIDNQFCYSTSQLAYALPTQVFYSEIFQIIDAGSSVRRSLLDWGLFHVKHEYLSLWKRYKKVLKQRNALLKTQAKYEEFVPWDKQLSALAEELHSQRVEYFALWKEAFSEVLTELTTTSCTIEYFKGWDKRETGKSLQDILIEAFESDKQKTYTQYGPHQADILIESCDVKAKHSLSRGQQKMILFALKLAQANLLEKRCLYLIDDFSAELDESHQRKLMAYLENREGQYVISSTGLTSSIENFPSNQQSLYYINEGNVSRETFECEVVEPFDQ